MKKIILIILFISLGVGVSKAQKFAFIDSEYILKNISSYETAQEQLEILSKKWQGEIEQKQNEVKSLYQAYQADLAFLSAEQKTKKENQIVAKEKELAELNQKYFGPEGALYENRKKLVEPIQNQLYDAAKEIANAQGYSMILDRATTEGVIFVTPRIDISNEVLAKLGYSK